MLSRCDGRRNHGYHHYHGCHPTDTARESWRPRSEHCHRKSSSKPRFGPWLELLWTCRLAPGSPHEARPPRSGGPVATRTADSADLRSEDARLVLAEARMEEAPTLPQLVLERDRILESCLGAEILRTSGRSWSQIREFTLSRSRSPCETSGALSLICWPPAKSSSRDKHCRQQGRTVPNPTLPGQRFSGAFICGAGVSSLCARGSAPRSSR